MRLSTPVHRRTDAETEEQDRITDAIIQPLSKADIMAAASTCAYCDNDVERQMACDACNPNYDNGRREQHLTGRGGPDRGQGRKPLPDQQKKTRIVLYAKPAHHAKIKQFVQSLKTPP